MSGAAAATATLLLIRHGETDWNAAARIQGQRDVALSARGHVQAQALARHFTAGDAAGPIRAVYASDLARARATAEPVARALGLALAIDARLRERAFGLFEGFTTEEAQARWPAVFAVWRRRDPGYALPGGGESYLQARARVLEFLREVAERHAGQAVALVTHGGVLDVVYRAANAIAWETPRSHLLPNASINRVLATLAPPRALALAVQSWAESAHLPPAADDDVG